MEPKEQMTF